MKLKILLSTFLFIGILKSSGQTVLDTDGLNNLNNVYLFSLKVYCSTLDSSKTKTIYIKDEYFIGESWPKEISGFKINYLNSSEYKKTIKENGGNIILVGISPLEFSNDKFYVGVIPFSASYKKKVVNLVNGGGLTVYFKYDLNKKGLVYKSKEWSGI
jgi:hypothetical protein